MNSKKAAPFLALLACAGCHPAAPPRLAGPSSDSVAAEAGFSAPPKATGLTARAGGGITVSGVASPDAAIRLATPGGKAFTAKADGRGVWAVRLPPLAAVTLLGLSAQAETRAVQAEGYLALLPSPAATGALLRAGAGATRIGKPAPGLRLQAVDLDAAGAAVLSGSAPPGANLTATVDGVTVASGTAEPNGEFTLALLQPLVAGRHALSVRTVAEIETTEMTTSRPSRPGAGPFSAVRQATSWRIDWITPGGGLQSTLLVDKSEPSL